MRGGYASEPQSSLHKAYLHEWKQNKNVFKLIFEFTTENMKIIFFFFIKLQQNANST